MSTHLRLALVGPGRAGTAITEGLVRAGVQPVAVAGRAPDAPSVTRAAAHFGIPATPVEAVGAGADVVVLATPDHVLAAVADAVAGSLEADALVVHLSGVHGLEVFDALRVHRPDVRVGALHPLQTLGGVGDHHRLVGAWFAVDGDTGAAALVEVLGGRAVAVADRATYHAAAAVAANHVVALLAQVERLAGAAGLPLEAFRPLVEAAVANAFDRGPAEALTGPVARGDSSTVAHHLAALPADERSAYLALAREALRLSGRHDPELEGLLEAPSLVGGRL